MKNHLRSGLFLASLLVAFPAAGRAQSATATAPAITAQPTSQAAVVGAPVTFTVSATGIPTPRYQWQRNGQWIFGADSPTYTIAAAKISDAGAYSVVVSNDSGTVTSNLAALSVMSGAGVVSSGPQDASVDAGANATFSVTASGSGLTYQWSFEGLPIQGATSSSYTVSNAGVEAAGAYSVRVSGGSGVVAEEFAILAVNVDARLTNLSVRGNVAPGDRALIVGLTIKGTGSKQVLLRAIGPTLSTFGVTGVLPDPVLTLYGANHASLATDAGWGGTAALSAAFAQVGAFALPSDSADSAILQTLSSGAYSAEVTSASGSTGVALAEVYDADTGTPTASLVNLSARAYVDSKTLIAGFVVTGSTSETVLIRGVGPSLGGLFGFGDALRDTQLTLFDAQGNQIAANSGWDNDPRINDAGSRVGAFLLMANSLDSALLVTLPPGTYTAQVTWGGSHSAGIGMVEVYEVK